MLKKILFFAIVTLLFIACGNKQGGEQSDDMAQFAEDTTFKEAHDEPEDFEFQAKGQMIEYNTPDGKKASAYALMPEGETSNYLLVIHEWWGLNDHIKREAERLFDTLNNVKVLALDMYDGKVATTQDEAGKYMEAMSQERGRAIVQGALNYAGDKAEIATIGWCFGGGWSLQASIMAGNRGKACVMYYGMPIQNAKDLAPLEAPILGIFAEKDGWINPEVVKKFQELAKATGKDLEVHSFNADHAFANPSNPNYDKESTQQARRLTLNFLQEHLLN